MATKKTGKARKEEILANFNPVLLDEAITSEDGEVTLHLKLNIQKFLERKENYADALMNIRHLPYDLELVSGSDPIALLVASQRPAMVKADPNSATRYAVQYYKQHISMVQQEAAILVFISSKENNSLLDKEPLPYDDKQRDEDDDLPGILFLPEPRRDLTDPVEIRLRNFYEVLSDHGDLIQAFYTRFNAAMGVLSERAKELGERDEAGFRTPAAS